MISLLLTVLLLGQIAQVSPIREPPVSSDDPAQELLQPIADSGEYDALVKKGQQLIKQLSADTFAERQAASEALTSIGCRSIEALKEVTKSADAEARTRAEKLIESFERDSILVVDAVGNPTNGGRLTFYSKTQHKIKTYRIDKCGRAIIPGFNRRQIHLDGAYAVFENDDYGVAKPTLRYEVTEPENRYLEKILSVSLVHKKSFTFQRAIRGRIIDESGTPIAGADISCRGARTNGGRAISPQFEQHVMSDAKGEFSLYLDQVMSMRRANDSRLIPLGARHHVSVSANGFFPGGMTVYNDEPVKIKLYKPTREYQVKLEDPDGNPLDTKSDPHALRVSYSRPDEKYFATVEPDRFLSGRLISGKYRARWNETHFPDMELNKDSPDEIVLRLPKPRTFTGTVVDGITRKPIEGVIVLTESSRGDRKWAALTSDQWDLLEKQEAGNFDEEALKVLRRMHGSELTVTRTSADGTFSITEFARCEAQRLAFAKRDSLAVFAQGMIAYIGAGNKPFEIELFPAAYVQVGIAATESSSAYPNWILQSSDVPGLVQKVEQWKDRELFSFESPHLYNNGKKKRVAVPAGVQMQIEVNPSKEQFRTTRIPKSFKLQPGEEFDLGEVTFPEAEMIKLTVVVVDENGRPGIPVRLDKGLAELTNVKGKATLRVRVGRETTLRVTGMKIGHPLKESENLNVKLHTINEQQPVNIRLTAEQHSAIRNSKADGL